MKLPRPQHLRRCLTLTRTILGLRDILDDRETVAIEWGGREEREALARGALALGARGGTHDAPGTAWIRAGGVAGSPSARSAGPFGSAFGGPLAGLKHDPAIDGVNILPAPSGQAKEAPHDALFWRFRAQAWVRRGDWKLLTYGPTVQLLFNVAEDMGEETNLADAHPDTVARLA